jgi:YfiH family protein
MPTAKSGERDTAKKSSHKKGAAAPRGPQLQIIQAGVFADVPWLLHGFSPRRGGFSKAYGGHALNLGITKEDTKAAVERNRDVFQKKLGAPGWPLVHMHQVHSDVIHRVDGAALNEAAPGHGRIAPGLRPGELRYVATVDGITCSDGKPLLVGDGLITYSTGLLLAVKTADCMPIIIVDPKKRAVGVLHAGWRGTLKRIAEKGVGEMRRWFDSKPGDLKAALGPSIRNCCYNVGEEVRDHFRSQFEYADSLFREWQTYEDIHLKYPLLFLTQRAPGHSELPYRIFLDLAEANRRQLLDAGLREKNIEVINGCTSCDTKRFFSHRKEKGVTGRMMAVVGIK